MPLLEIHGVSRPSIPRLTECPLHSYRVNNIDLISEIANSNSKKNGRIAYDKMIGDGGGT